MRTLRDLLRRLWPRRLAGQLIALLLLALILAQGVTFLIFADERREAIRTVERWQVLERTATLVRLIESSPPSLHEQIARTGGIGLGMAIARSIVRGHGGDITLANRTGGGLRATIRLPRAEAV